MAAPTPDTPPAPRRRRIRRRVIVLLIPVILLTVGWQFAKHLINIERYRPLIDRELELLIELPITFGAMKLQLLPTPRLVVEDVSLGEEDFKVFSPRVSVTADLFKLYRKQLSLELVTIHEAQVQLPAEIRAFRERWSDYMLALNTPDPGGAGEKPMLKVTLEAIEASNVEIFRGSQRFATGKLRVSGVTAGTPLFAFDGQSTADFNEVAARGELVLDVRSEPLIQGKATLSSLPLVVLTGEDQLPNFLLDADLTYAQAQNGVVTADAAGQFRLSNQADALGPFEVAVRYDSGDLALENVRIDTTPLQFLGAIHIHPDNRWTLDTEEATLKNQGIAWLTAWMPEIPVAVTPGHTAEGVLRNLHMGTESGTGYSFAAGTMEVTGLGLRLGESGLVLPDVNGTVTITNDQYQFSSLRNAYLEASGSVFADYAADRVSMDLSGLINLSPEVPLPGPLSDSIRLDAGTVNIPSLHAVVEAGILQPTSVAATFELAGGAISLRDRVSDTYAPVTDIVGSAAIEEGVLLITSLQSPDTKLSGSLTPDATFEHWAVDGVLSSDLANPIWKAIYPSALITVHSGALTDTRLEGVFSVEKNNAPELNLSATIQDLDADLHTAAYADTLQVNSLTLKTEEGAIVFDVDGDSLRLGSVSAKGNYRLDSGDIDATASWRPTAAGALPDAYREGPIGTVLKAMGTLPLHINYEGVTSVMRFTSETAALVGVLGFGGDAADRAPVSLTVTASLPSRWLAPYLAPEVETTGVIAIEASLAKKTGGLKARADLKDAAFGWSIFRKPVGYPALLKVAGAWSGKGIELSGGRVEAGGEHADFSWSNGALQIESLAVSLAPLSPLLPEGGVLSGRIEGSYAEKPAGIALKFDEVLAELAPDIPPVKLRGSINRKDARWRIENLAWMAGESRGIVQLRTDNGIWAGRLDADRINLTELTQGYRAFNVWRNAPTERDPNEKAWDFSGDFAVICKSLSWADAVVENARTTAQFSPGGLRMPDFVFQHGSGIVSGPIAYTQATAATPARAELSLSIAGVSASLLEGLFMDKARGLDGTLNGRVDLSIPIVPSSPSVVRNMSGRIEFEGVDGNLGKAGLASKLVAALRTTDLLRLRVPQLKDRGLTYKTLSGNVTIESGVFRLAPFAVTDSAYALEAEATFNVPDDTADGGGEIQVLEGVTGIARKIPILGGAANMVSKALGVPFRISGPASDPIFRVGMPGADKP